MSEPEKLITYLRQEFSEIKSDLTDLHIKFDRLQTTVDGFAKQAETNEDERLVLSHQLNRQTDWIERAAKKLGIKFNNAFNADN